MRNEPVLCVGHFNNSRFVIEFITDYDIVLMGDMPSTIVLSKVHIKNIRSIRECTLEFERSNYLFGPNDSGKSNLLYALELALTNRRLIDEDVYKPRDEEDCDIVVDLMFRPTEGRTFDKMWKDEFDLPSVDTDGEYYAFRTSFQYDSDNDIYRKRRRRINVWGEVITASNNVISEDIMELFGCYNIDAHRDLSEDLISRQSLWNKKLSAMDVPDGLRQKYAQIATDINQRIITDSRLLSDLSSAFDSVPTGGRLYIDSLPTDIKDVYRGLDIKVDDGKKVLPISSKGMGTRSVAAIAAARELSDREIRGDDPHYTLLMMEEPEAHLHPHLQSKVNDLLLATESQIIVTTHSSYLLSKTDVRDMICCHHTGTETEFTRCPGMSEEEYEAMNSNISLNYPIMMFAKLVVLIEGKTERIVMPIYFRDRFKTSPESAGISIIGVGGTEYRNFLKVLDAFHIPWVIFSDGEKGPVKNVAKAISYKGDPNDLIKGDDSRVLILPNGQNYEKYVASAIPSTVAGFLEDYDSHRYHNNRLNVNKNKLKTEEEILGCILEGGKTEYAAPLANLICEKGLVRELPMITKLLDKIQEALKP